MMSGLFWVFLLPPAFNQPICVVVIYVYGVLAVSYRLRTLSFCCYIWLLMVVLFIVMVVFSRIGRLCARSPVVICLMATVGAVLW